MVLVLTLVLVNILLLLILHLLILELRLTTWCLGSSTEGVRVARLGTAEGIGHLGLLIGNRCILNLIELPLILLMF